MRTSTQIRLGHDDLGTGEPALVFVPGWCGDRDVFDPLVPLASRHRRAVAVDLPDQGGSERVSQDFDTDTVVDSLVALVDRLGIERFVPVGLAHAGWSAVRLRQRLGGKRVPGIVLLDWMVLGTPPGFADALQGLQQQEAWEQVRAGLFSMWTTGVDVPALHRYVGSMGRYGFEHWSRAGREIAAAFAAHGSPVAALESMDPPCPTLHAYAQPADDGFLAAQQAYAAEHPWFTVRRLRASSHFPMFEVPGEIAELVEEHVRSLG
jgi:pimeloyl-ACP methyl ester carboxylesterase